MKQAKTARSVEKAREPRKKLTAAQLRQIGLDLEELSRDRLFGLVTLALRALDADTAVRVLGSVGIRLEDRRRAAGDADLLRDMETFCRESYAGEYYESFNVNSRNFSELSAGTLDWTRKCERLGARCLAGGAKKATSAGAKACGLLVQMLHHVDEGHDDIVFWADEGGTWQVEVDKDRLQRAWFEGLAKTASDGDYVEAAKVAIGMVWERERTAVVQLVRRVASASQRKALTSAGIVPVPVPIEKRVKVKKVGRSKAPRSTKKRSFRALEAMVREAMRR